MFIINLGADSYAIIFFQFHDNKIVNLIYVLLCTEITVRESKLFNEPIIILSILLIGITIIGTNNIYGFSIPPANNTIKSNLDNTLNSIASNASKSIQGDLDKVLSDTMDIQIKNALEQLSNSTIIGNSDQSVPKFQTKVPSGVDVFEVGHISTSHHHR